MTTVGTFWVIAGSADSEPVRQQIRPFLSRRKFYDKIRYTWALGTNLYSMCHFMFYRQQTLLLDNYMT